MTHINAHRLNLSFLLSLLLVTATMVSCNIYDDTDDCKTEFRLRFVYDMNMKYADAFQHEVKSVCVYAFDSKGQLALKKQETVASDSYTMSVNELKANEQYTFVVWALGQDNGECYQFGSGTEQDLTAKLIRSNGEVNQCLTPLFHGRLANQTFKQEYNTTQTIDIQLTKDTKNIKVVLQELNPSSEAKPTRAASDYTMSITDDNGFLAYDNSLLSDETLSYLPWSVTEGEAGVDEGDTKTQALIAEISTNRLVQQGHSPRLTVRGSQGETILSIPLIDYFLLVKGEYNSSLSDQEYLDRQDSYDLVFFLDNGKWMNAYIYVNSWKVVPPQSSDL